MTTEHRSRPRTNLHVPLYLLPVGSSELIQTETENVSMSGFFCYSSRLHAPGERFRFLLRLSPSASDAQPARPVYLDGLAEVVHVRIGHSAQGFGLGCRVEGYRVLPQSEISDRAEIIGILSDHYHLDRTAKRESTFPVNISAFSI